MVEVTDGEGKTHRFFQPTQQPTPMEPTIKPKDQRDAEAHETSMVATAWNMEGEKIWCLHRALTHGTPDGSAAETLANLGLGQKAAPGLFTEDQRNQLVKRYFDKLNAL